MTLFRLLPSKWIAAALAALGLLYAAYSWAYTRGAASRDPEVAALNTTIANMKAASEKAQADNHAFVERMNALQNQITKDRNDEAPKVRAQGSAAIDAYVRMHPAPATDPHLSYEGGASGISSSSGEPDGAIAQAVVSRSDLDACNDAYAVATGLQGWIRDQMAINRQEPMARAN